MAGQAPPSRRELIRQWRQGAFVGRQDELAAFTSALGRPPEATPQFLFHIHGPAGVGKSTLVRQLEGAAREAGAGTSYVDESVADGVEAMELISAQLAQQGMPLKNFDRMLSTYRQRRHEASAAVPAAESAPGAPDAGAPPAPSAGSVVASQLSLAGLGLIPGAGVITGAVDPNQLAAGADRIKAALSSRLRSSDDVQLVLSPLRTLTPVFLRDLAEHSARRPWTAVFFDTYERIGPLLDFWLRDLLLSDRYGELPANVLVVLAGQKQLDPHCWGDWRDLITDLPLEVFTEAEARQFLTAKSITDERVIEVILQLSGRLPVLLSTLAEARPSAVADVGDPSGTAVERFLRWEPDPDRRAAALAAALPQELDEDVFAAAVAVDSPQDAAPLFAWLRSMPFVTDRGGRIRYHDVVRSSMLRLQRRQSPTSWQARHARLADSFRDRRLALEEGAEPEDGWWEDEAWRACRLQETYHRLCADPRGALPGALRELVDAYDVDLATLRRWVQSLVRAGEDGDAAATREWGTSLRSALEAPEPGVAVLTLLLDRGVLDEDGLVLAYAARAWDHRVGDRMTEALADYAEALERRPDSVRALVGRGTTYRMMRLYDESLADFDEAVRIDPDRWTAHGGRGETLRMAGRHEEALAALDVAVGLRPDRAWPLGSRGAAHRSLNRYEQALADFDRALELDPDYAWSLANRGLTHRRMGHYDKALADYDRAIELDPAYAWALTHRGIARHHLQRLEDALADLEAAVELNPDSAWARANRGAVHQALHRWAEALADFDGAVALNPEYVWALTHRGNLRRLMGATEGSLTDLDRALEIDPESVWALTSRGHEHRLAGRIDEALADFGRVLELRPEDAQAIAGRGVAHRYAGRYEEARTALDRALELDHGNHWFHYELSVVLHALGDPGRHGQSARTVELLNQALADGASDISYRGNLVLVHSLTAAWPEAERALTDFLAQDPAPGSAAELLIALTSLHPVVPDAGAHLAAFGGRLEAAALRSPETH